MQAGWPSAGWTVRQGTPGDIPVVSRLLARALEDDPLSRMWFPRASTREARLRRMLESSAFQAYAMSNGMEIISDNSGVVAGCALWVSTHHIPASTSSAQMMHSWRIFGRQSRQTRQFAAIRTAARVVEHHWHLTTLGTRADMRGRGYGRVLVESGLQRCRADGLPAQLETSNGDNVPFYERFGFEVTGVVDAPEFGPRTWLMRYQP